MLFPCTADGKSTESRGMGMSQGEVGWSNKGILLWPGSRLAPQEPPASSSSSKKEDQREAQTALLRRGEDPELQSPGLEN